ncbi:N-6 DNA methylase [Streptomyces sp. PA03-5A]|nr:N-6 DNA methylase [Streptomyces sp. PA03-5A]
MSTTTRPAVAVTLAEIARLAGVGRAAVSNWRRRYENFPAPTGGTDASPLFSLSDVEDWLHKENKVKIALGSLERLWPEFDALGDRDAMGQVVAAIGARLAGSPGQGQAFEPAHLDDRQIDLMERAVALADGEGVARTFEFLLERWLRTHVRQVAVTPEPLGELMADLASLVHDGDVLTMLDPACGAGSLLMVAARCWPGTRHEGLLGQDNDPVLASLTAARLAMNGYTARVTASDTLRADAHAGVRTDVVLCNPPSNERDWGHAELATDTRWVYGQPPRTESELAWVQHAIAALAPGGVAVLVLPPAVAARRAGRRIRAALLRDGALQAVIALPPGAAPPHGVGLHLWLLRAPDSGRSSGRLLLVDTARELDPTTLGKSGIDWAQVRAAATAALRGEETPCSVSVPVIELLDDQVDLTPARHIRATDTASIVDLRRSWTQFDAHLSELKDLAAALSTLTPLEGDDGARHTTVAELERAGALEIRNGQALPEPLLQRGDRPDGAVPVVTVPDLLTAGEPEHWLPAPDVARGNADGTLMVTASHDVVVVGLTRSFNVWVDTRAPSVLGPQLFALRTDPGVLDPWFLAGCLRAPANARQAGTHASTSSRVDVRRLQVPRFSLEEQQRYGEIFRKLAALERELLGLRTVGGELVGSLGDLLAAGRLPGH